MKVIIARRVGLDGILELRTMAKPETTTMIETIKIIMTTNSKRKG